ncbi:AbrB/MazE/SpoVT family DNA-binding domain-containing protein [Candidatus Pacearchaeota archaeon]|nr:AbrB/MazE/SpoVT family DNA-binding domain-containing protein [Candidatus Pacearchaeota archaeon]
MDKYKILRKIRKNGTSLAINIPQEVIELLEIKEGELVEVEIRKIK